MKDQTLAAEGLLQPDDPAPYTIENADGLTPVVFVCDHASSAVPAALGTLGLDPAELQRHIAIDLSAAEVTRRLATRFGGPAVMAAYSRLVIDCNRQLGHPESVVRESDGTVIPANQSLTEYDIALRVDGIFRPYHAAINRIIADFDAAGRVPALIAVHSFTPTFAGTKRPWHVGILWDRDPRIPVPLIEALGRDSDIVVGDNQPYSGRAQYGYTVEEHAAKTGLPHVLIELREDVIRTEAGIAEWTRRLGDALAAILADPAIHRRERF